MGIAGRSGRIRVRVPPRLLEPIALVLALAAAGSPAAAQVVFDSSLGAPGEAPLDPGGTTWQIEQARGQAVSGGGRTNLFFSFERFDVPADRTAEFQPQAGVDSIFSRVTSGGSSQIDGGLRVRVAGGGPGSPDLFFLNPQGVVFGGAVRLDLDGAFYASSASGVAFEDGGFFSARDPAAALPGAAGAPALLRFDGGSVGDVLVSGRITSSESGGARSASAVGLIGREVRVSGAGPLAAQGATLQLGAVGSSAVDLPLDLRTAPLGPGHGGGGIVELDAAAGGALTVSTLSAGADQGRIVIRGGSLVLREAGLFAGGNGEAGDAGFAIDVAVADRIEVDGVSAKIESQGRLGSGPGDLRLRAGRVEIVDGGGVWTTTLPGAGTTGSLSVEADSLRIAGANSSILSRTRGTSPGGALRLRADAIRIENEAVVLSDSVASPTLDVGATGAIELRAGSLVLVDRARIASVTNDAGAGGAVSVDAGSIELDGGSRILAETRASAPGGDLEIRAETLLLSNDSSVTTGSTSDATSGDVRIDVDSLRLTSRSGIGSGLISPVPAGAEPFRGPGGSVEIFARDALVEDAQISTSTDGAGEAGDLVLEVENQLVIQGRIALDRPAGLFARSGVDLGSGATGDGGAIRVRAGSLRLADGAQLNSTTVGPGRAGEIEIATKGDLVIDGGRVSTVSASVGATGDLTLVAGRNLLVVGGAEIVSEAPVPRPGPGLPGDPPAAGGIVLSAANDLVVENTRIATDSARPESGDVRLEAGRGLTLVDTSVTTNVDAPSGRGGDILLESGALVLADARVTANADGSNADAGNIALVAEAGLLQSAASVVEARAALGVSGQILRATPETNLPEELGRSAASVKREADVVVDGCSTRRGAAGSFSIGGRIERVPSPERLLPPAPVVSPAPGAGEHGPDRERDACTGR